MEVILKQDIQSIGHKNDIVTVKNGYGRNFLIPKGMATLATESAKKMHAENLRQRAHKEEKIKNEALEIAKKLEKVAITIGAKTSSTGKIFGSVNTIQIAEALKEKGYEIERKNISISDDQVKEVGKYKAIVKLHKEVKVEIEFEIVAE
jgi:large subunit ribosomal protein L9